MIRHVVMFEFANQAEGRSKMENAVIVRDQLLALKDKMDFIKNLEVGINESEADCTNYTLCLTCDFESWEDLKNYNTDPDHLKVGALISKVKLGRSCVDYEK